MTSDDRRQGPASKKIDSSPAPLYRDKRTERFANGDRVKEFQSFERQAKKRLRILLDFVLRNGLMLLPSNHFEALGGDRTG